jgi:hypothetical protein
MNEYVPRILELVPHLWESDESQLLRPVLLSVLKSAVIV